MALSHVFVQGSHAFALFLAHALRECALFRNTTYYTYARVRVGNRDVSSLLLQFFFSAYAQMDTITNLHSSIYTYSLPA